MSVSAHDLAMLYTASLFKKLDTILETNRVPNVTTQSIEASTLIFRELDDLLPDSTLVSIHDQIETGNAVISISSARCI